MRGAFNINITLCKRYCIYIGYCSIHIMCALVIKCILSNECTQLEHCIKLDRTLGFKLASFVIIYVKHERIIQYQFFYQGISSSRINMLVCNLKANDKEVYVLVQVSFRMHHYMYFLIMRGYKFT